MTSRRNRRRFAGVIVAALAAGTISAIPASAECLSAEAYYYQPGDTRTYVVGPKECVVATPYEGVVGYQGKIIDNNSVVTVGVGVWVPVP